MIYFEARKCNTFYFMFLIDCFAFSGFLWPHIILEFSSVFEQHAIRFCIDTTLTLHIALGNMRIITLVFSNV